MNMTQSILDRELLTQNSILNIVLLGQEPKAFLDFLNKLSHKYILYDNLYYGNYQPNLIICNNKITHYDMCRELSIRYHIPIITVDHYAKTDLLDNDKIKFIDNLPCSFKIATNMSIYKSWNSIHDKILPYDINSSENITIWKELLFQTSKKVFQL